MIKQIETELKAIRDEAAVLLSGLTSTYDDDASRDSVRERLNTISASLKVALEKMQGQDVGGRDEQYGQALGDGYVGLSREDGETQAWEEQTTGDPSTGTGDPSTGDPFEYVPETPDAPAPFVAPPVEPSFKPEPAKPTPPPTPPHTPTPGKKK